MYPADTEVRLSLQADIKRKSERTGAEEEDLQVVCAEGGHRER
jgi:hypothetical protein